MSKLFYTIGALIMPLLLSAQNRSFSPDNSFGVELLVGAQDHGFINEPFLYTVCIEGCTPIEQTGEISGHFSAKVFQQLWKRHFFKIGYFTHKRVLVEQLRDEWFGGVFEERSDIRYRGLMLGYQFNFWHQDRLRLFMDHGVLWENPQNPIYGFLLKDVFSYSGKLGADYFPGGGRYGVSLQPFIMLPLSSYSDRQLGEFDRYAPYAIGVSLGLKLNLF